MAKCTTRYCASCPVSLKRFTSRSVARAPSRISPLPALQVARHLAQFLRRLGQRILPAQEFHIGKPAACVHRRQPAMPAEQGRDALPGRLRAALVVRGALNARLDGGVVRRNVIEQECASSSGLPKPIMGLLAALGRATRRSALSEETAGNTVSACSRMSQAAFCDRRSRAAPSPAPGRAIA